MNRPARGFTLMEMLVVLVITALLMTMLFQSLGILRRAQARVDARGLRARQAELADAWYRGTVEGLYAPDTQAFEGDAGHWQGSTLQSLAGTPGAPTPVRWRLTAGTRGARLEYRSGDDAPIEFELPTAQDDLHFAYVDETGERHATLASREGSVPALAVGGTDRSGRRGDAHRVPVRRRGRTPAPEQRAVAAGGRPVSRRSGVRVLARRKAGGYVLLATLVILVVMTLLASSIAITTERAVADRRAADERLQATIDANSTAATVFYLLSTQRQTFAGVTVDKRMVLTADEQADQDGGGTPVSLREVGNELRLDGQTYAGVGGIRFSLQDDRGRIAVNWQSPATLTRLLGEFGVRAEDVPPLLDKLKDYQDADDLPRLNGAEAEAYRRAGLPPPANRTLTTPLELRRVLGWRERLAGIDDQRLLDLVSVFRSAMLNVNTAGTDALRTIPGVDSAVAARIVARRQQIRFASVFEMTRLAGLLLDDDQAADLGVATGGGGTLSLWSPGLGYLRQIHWTLTPIDDGGRPWRSEYSFALPLPENADGIPAEKPGTTVFDDPLPAR